MIACQAKAASAFAGSFPLKPLENERAAKAAPSRLARGPSTDRLKALSVVDDDDWCKGVSFADWHDLVQRSFERHFWIPEDAAEDGSYAMGGATPWVRGMYKDCLGCHDEWCMLQLRPNQAIAMAVAPSLFDPDHARVRSSPYRIFPATVVPFTHKQVALKICRERLLSKMGMRVRRRSRRCSALTPLQTLDSSDMAYRPNYDRCSPPARCRRRVTCCCSAEDGTSKATAKGWNYHQGPGAAALAPSSRPPSPHLPCRMAVAHRLLLARLRLTA